jgi:outer membrane lipoprotein SlyB
MNSHKLALLASFAALTLVTACGSNPSNRNTAAATSPGAYSNVAQYGRVDRIDMVPGASRSPRGGGAIVGAVIGAVIGNQVGKGNGRAVATVAGAVGGAAIGNEVDRRDGNTADVYRVQVRLDNGRVEQFDYDSLNELRVGDRVRLQDGQLYHM